MTDQREAIQGEFSELLFAVRRSTRYHRARMRFFDLWATMIQLISVVSATAAFSAVYAELPKDIALAAASILALAQAIELVIAPSKSARLHSDLARRFISLEKLCIKEELGLDDQKLLALENERLEIELEEPPLKKWLNVRVHNEMDLAENGKDATPYPIRRYQRLFIQLADIDDISGLSAAKPGGNPPEGRPQPA